MRTRLAVIGVVLALAAGVFAPVERAGATSRSAKIDTKGVLKYGLDLTVSGAGGEISLDPTKMSGSPFNITPARLIYDTLVRLDQDGNPHPGLATAWTFPDDRTIELTLRKGVKFQDGTAFNAAAVKAGLERTRASGNPLLNKNFLELDSVEAVADDTVRIHLKTPVLAAFFGLLSTKETFIPSPTAVQKEGSDFGQHPVGAGPYKLERFEPEQLIAVRKFKGFWQKSGWKLAGVDFVQSQNGPPRVTALLSENIDLTVAPDRATIEALHGRPGVIVTTRPSDASMMHFDMCVTTPPFDKLEVRQALAHLVDRDALNQAVTGGAGVVTDEAWTKDSAFYTKSVANKYPRSVKKAKALLEKAGLGDGFEFTLMTFPSPTFVVPAEVLQQNFKEAGITANIVQASNYVQDLFTDNKAPATVIQTIMGGTGKVNPVDPSSIANWCHYKNPKVSEAITTLKSTVGDAAKQKAAWNTINIVLANDVPMLFLFFNPVGVAYFDRVGGVKELYGTSEGPNFETVYLKK